MEHESKSYVGAAILEDVPLCRTLGTLRQKERRSADCENRQHRSVERSIAMLTPTGDP
jgi:hypothetical protein